MIRRLKPTKLPSNPTFLDRLEYGLQWLVGWFVIDIPGHPLISGMLTGLLLFVPIIPVAALISFVLGAISHLFK
jgi:hypothetical protein